MFLLSASLGGFSVLVVRKRKLERWREKDGDKDEE